MDTDAVAASLSPSPSSSSSPGLVRYILGFLFVGIAWGFTTPFIRKAALQHQQLQKNHDESRKWLMNDDDSTIGITMKMKRKVWKVGYSVLDVLRRPGYAIPLAVNLGGAVGFWVLIGEAELSLMVPITNSLAFLFTVLGEWWADGKVISKDTWLGIAFVLGGITLCVHAKNT